MARANKRTLSIEGLKEVIDMIQDMEQVAQEVVDPAAKAGAKIGLGAAIANAPSKTGKLKRSLTLKKAKTKSKLRAAYKVGTKGVKYSFYVEAGTKKMPARPYIRPAIDENRDKIDREIKKEIIKGLDGVI